jgi:hypothetical protein
MPAEKGSWPKSASRRDLRHIAVATLDEPAPIENFVVSHSFNNDSKIRRQASYRIAFDGLDRIVHDHPETSVPPGPNG